MNNQKKTQNDIELPYYLPIIPFFLLGIVLVIIALVTHEPYIAPVEPMEPLPVVEPVKFIRVASTPKLDEPEPEPIEPEFTPSENIPLSDELQIHTYEKSEQYNLDYFLPLAIMQKESGFDINAIGVNPKGSIDSGICQINSCNIKWAVSLGLDISDPYDNIEFACVMLSDLLEKYDLETALAAYNHGHKRRFYPKAKEYAKDVIGIMEELKNEN